MTHSKTRLNTVSVSVIILAIVSFRARGKYSEIIAAKDIIIKIGPNIMDIVIMVTPRIISIRLTKLENDSVTALPIADIMPFSLFL